MGQVRHGSGTTTHAVRAAIQRSQASLSQLSRELGINPKTVAKWRKRATVEDLKTGPKEPRSSSTSWSRSSGATIRRASTSSRAVGWRLGDVAPLAGGDDQAKGPAQRVSEHVDLAGQPASGTPQRLILGPPFPVAAC